MGNGRIMFELVEAMSYVYMEEVLKLTTCDSINDEIIRSGYKRCISSEIVDSVETMMLCILKNEKYYIKINRKIKQFNIAWGEDKIVKIKNTNIFIPHPDYLCGTGLLIEKSPKFPKKRKRK